MAQPTPYQPAYSFTQYQTSHPADPLPGSQVDSELANVAVFAAEVTNNLRLIQRDDGALANQSVGTTQLQEALSVGINTVTTWIAATAYVPNNFVYAPDGDVYQCNTAHTSTVFANDLAAGYWRLILTFQAAITSNAQATASASAAAASAAAAAASVRNIPGGYANVFHNPNFFIAQRGGSGSIINGVSYTADRWLLSASGSALLWSAGSSTSNLSVPGVYLLNLVCAAGVTDASLTQRVESFDSAAKLFGNQCTIQFTIFNETGAAFTPTLTLTAPSTQDNFGGSSVTLLNAQALQPCPNNAITTVAYTVLMSNTNVANGLQATLDFGNALNHASGTGVQVQVGAADLRVTPGVALGLNANPPVPEIRSVPAEQAMCERFLRVLPASNLGAVGWGWASAANTFEVFIPFRTKMRAIPSMTGPAAGQFQFNFQAVTSYTASNGDDSTVDTFSISGTSSGSGGVTVAAGGGGAMRWITSASGNLVFSAEL